MSCCDGGDNFDTTSGVGIMSISGGTTFATGPGVSLSNANGVSFGVTGNTITASVAAAGAPIAFGANTATQSSGTIVVSNSNNVSFGMAGSTITASASFAQSTAPAAISAAGSSVSSGTVVFSNSNNVSFGMNGNTITASASAQRSYSVSAVSAYADFANNVSWTNGMFLLQKVSIPMFISASAGMLALAMSGNSANPGSASVSMGVYTLTGQTANLASSGSRLISWSSGSDVTASSFYGGVSGTRMRTIPLAANLTPGDYLFAFHLQTGVTGVSWSFAGKNGANINAVYDNLITSWFFDGNLANTFATGMPAQILATDANYVRTGQTGANKTPGWILIGTF